MKFKLIDQYLYWWPVKVSIPDPNRPGKFLSQSFEMQFEALSKSEAEKLDALAASIETVEERQEHDNAVIAQRCKNWRGVVDEDNQEVAFSDDAFAQAMEFGWFRVGVLEAYAESISGEKARRGN